MFASEAEKWKQANNPDETPRNVIADIDQISGEAPRMGSLLFGMLSVRRVLFGRIRGRAHLPGRPRLTALTNLRIYWRAMGPRW